MHLTSVGTTGTSVRIHQISTPGLGDQSYLVVSGDEAVVVDPQRDLDRYLDAIAALGVRVAAVVETHVHNDYVSGGPALARHLGCPYVVPTGAGYRGERREVRDGDEIELGEGRLRALFTPGHTPHHMSYEVVEDGEVRAVLSGGCVLVGACGRTDLIDPDSTVELTRLQYRSAHRIGRNSDPTAIGPTHGSGSFCAASAASDETWTTVGKERERNPAFLATDEDDFVDGQLAGLSDYPIYYRWMGSMNREGQEGWTPAPPPELDAAGLDRLRAEGVVLVDTRSRHEFAAGHVPGSVNVELDDEVGTYLGWLWPAGTRFALIMAPDQDRVEPVRQCARVGIETIEGVLEGDGVEAWRGAGLPFASYPVTDVEGMAAALMFEHARALDVRQDTEWREGHVADALHIHVAELPPRVGEVPGDAPVYVYCRSGHRAAMGASLLDGAGVPAVLVDGGFPDWLERGLPVERDDPGQDG
jgi:hydroxyacylglutathione hydrolase